MDDPDDPWNIHECKVCPYKTRFLHIILSHVGLHRTRSRDHRFICDSHPPEMYRCDKCDFQSDFKVLLTKHLDTVHKMKETQHYPTPFLRSCDKCDFKTYSSLVLLAHENCCVRRFSSRDKNSRELGNKGKKRPNRRRGSKRKEDGFFHCRHCLHKTKFFRHLKTHMLWKHTPDDQINWFKCVHCSYKFKDKYKLRRHVLTKHSDPALRQFSCDQCPYRAARRDYLVSHIRRQHPPL